MLSLIRLALSRFVIAAGFLCLWSPSGQAIYIRHDVPVAEYNNLALQPQYQAVGYLGFTGAAFSFCAGTLVSPTAFLTAAHCLFDPNTGIPRPASDLNVGFGANFPTGGLGANNVASYSIDPRYLPSLLTRYDVAVLQVSTPVNNIAPAQIYLGDALGSVGTLIGYGLQGDGNGAPLVSANNELAANNAIDHFGNLNFLNNFTYELDFDNPAGTTNTFGSAQPLPLEGSPCFGDSGGPLFVDVGGKNVIAGDLSYRAINNFGPVCNYGTVVQYSYLADPITVAYLQSLDLGIGFLLVPEPSTFAIAIAFLVLTGAAVMARRRAE
jgi:hypothetical protein